MVQPERLRIVLVYEVDDEEPLDQRHLVEKIATEINAKLPVQYQIEGIATEDVSLGVGDKG